MNDSSQADLWEKSEQSPHHPPQNIQLFLAPFMGDSDQVPISFTLNSGLSPCDWGLKYEHRGQE